MLCCGRKKDTRHVIAQRLAGSTSVFLPNHPLYPQQQQYAINQSPYGTIPFNAAAVAQQQQLQLQQQLQIQQAQQQNLALQQAQQQQNVQNIPNIVVSTNNGNPSTSLAQQTKQVHFLNANISNAQPIYSNTNLVNSPVNNAIYGQIRANPLNQLNNQQLNRSTGISNDVYRQIAEVEKQFDQMNVNLDAIEKRGEMLIRTLDPRVLGVAGSQAGMKYLQQSANKGLQQSVQFIEIIKSPGQSLGLYIRDKDNQTDTEGVFISKIEFDSPLFNSGLLHVGDEILAVNLVDVAGMSVDDVCIIMSIPRRLILTIRTNNLSRLASNQINQQIRQALNNGDYVQLAQLQQIQQNQQQTNQPPIVVLKKEFGKEDELLYGEDGSNENLLGISQFGGNVVVANDEVVVNGNMIVYEDPYGRIGLRPKDECNWQNRNQFVIGGKTPFAVTQQPGNLRPGALRQLNDGIYGVIDHNATALLNRPASRLLANKLQTRASIHRPPTALSTTSNSLRRPGSRLLTESENRLLTGGLNPTLSDYFLEQIARPSSRLSTTANDYLLNRRRLAGLNQSFSTQGLSTLRRRSTIGGGPNANLFRPTLGPRSRSRLLMSDTASDSEFANVHLPARPASALGTPGYPHGFRTSSLYSNHHPALPPSSRYIFESGRASAMRPASALGMGYRSSSLPRQKPNPLDYRLGHHNLMGPSKLRRPGSSQVRFDKQNTYYSTYDEDSDALEDIKTAKYLKDRRNDPANYSDSEYRQWLTRAPSTSAIYDTVARKRSTLPIVPTNLPSNNMLSSNAVAVAAAAAAVSGTSLKPSSLNKIAHSAENLLDTIKNEQQKSLIDNNRYFNQNAPDLPPRPGIAKSVDNQNKSDYLLTSKSKQKKSLPMNNRLALDNKYNHQLLNKPNISNQLYQTNTQTTDTLQRTIPNPTPVKPTEDDRQRLLTLNPREFFKYKYEKLASSHENVDQLNELDIKPYSGLLYIHLLAGRGLRTNETSTYRDLYCVIECDRQHKARTVVRSGESSFDYDEKFELDIFEIKEISFLLYSWDTQYKHKLCYKGMINLSNLNLEQNSAHSLALKMDGKGTLYLKLVYSELKICYARRKSFSTSLFGCDLELVVAKENRGLNIPLIVKKCVEEVELRGMDLIGIYRICGSQIRKNQLKDAFEKNSYMVELGVDHVPDINNVTSLLKDYLRELPEPLFTKALYDMLIDGLSVCLPDDPSGNQRLMFDILECLPKVNRCTVLYLMDHLKAIVNNSERNKMTSQSIAIIFGPLFTCTDHFDSFNLRKTIEVFKFLLDIWIPSKKEISTLESVKINNSLNNQLNSSSTPSKSYLNNNNEFNSLIDKSNSNKSNLSLNDHRRHLSSDLSLDKDDLMNKSLIETNNLKKSTNHQFNSNQHQTSASSTNLNSLSSYSKPFSYHLPNNRDFNFTSSSNLNNTNSLLNKPNHSFGSLRNSTTAIDSTTSIGSTQLNNTNSNVSYFAQMGDSGLGSTTSGTGSSGTNSGGSSSGRNTGSSTSTVAKKTVGWASNTQDNLNQSPTSRLNTSLIGNTSSTNSSLIGNTNSSTSKYSTSDYLNDKYSNDISSRYNYSHSSSILDDNKSNNRNNVLIGTSSLLGDSLTNNSKYSDITKKYDSYG